MHGAGTKPGITINSARTRCLDLTRLISRAGRRLTGVDRVEMAYLTQFLELDGPLFALVRTSLGYVLLDRSGVAAIATCLQTNVWPARDILSRFTNRRHVKRQKAESALRQHALARCRPRGLARMIATHIPAGASYFNVGHANLSRRVLDAFAHSQRAVMIHDTIPLDYPEYQADGIPAAFAAKLRRVGDLADLIIYNSAQSQRDAQRYFDEWGQAPKGIVALLGVTEPDMTGGRWPEEVDPNRPAFVCVGTIEPRKNHALLLDVWDQLAQERAPAEMPQLVIAGARGWKNEKVFQRLDASDNAIIELNAISDPDLFTLLNGATALLFPSVAEGFGLPPAEAALLGTPVLCADLPVYREFLGDIPVYLDVNDGYLWKKAVETLLERGTQRPDRQAISDQIALPTWTEHFNIVLRVA
ncbi:glycosyltransferase family 1 protein [Cognatishimia sp. MH4019]|uniref:glycosyltransferase family 4 protein n=1 Tax=Cognatishimia sp. MH4019 TaxID=2854030 RepID=UPI001CD292D9|nr:glycosyltransferase family 1 protein [Cognatishimia sp. MH4019]